VSKSQRNTTSFARGGWKSRFAVEVRFALGLLTGADATSGAARKCRDRRPLSIRDGWDYRWHKSFSTLFADRFEARPPAGAGF